MDQKERMSKGLLYLCGDENIRKEQDKCLERLYDYNQTRPSEIQKRAELLNEMFGRIGNGCYIEPPLHCNFGGKHVFFGDCVYANFNLTLVDDGNIYVGNDVLFGPNVTIATASHPVQTKLRKRGYQFNKDVHIGNNVWIASGVVILPGITIGDNSIIGAGSVVTKDIPTNVVAYGNPCKVKRIISEDDEIYFYKKERIDWENIKDL